VLGFLQRLFGGGARSEAAYTGLRNQALTVGREAAGVAPPGPDAPIWLIMVELGTPKATASLVAIADGTTSLYLSTGGGVIGGGAHEQVRSANASLLRTANALRDRMQRVTVCERPPAGSTAFHARTDGGFLSYTGTDLDLARTDRPMSSLFMAAHRVLGELRVMTQRAQGA